MISTSLHGKWGRVHILAGKWILLFSGNIGPELSTNSGMFITSDAGNTWRQVRVHRLTFRRLSLLGGHQCNKCTSFHDADLRRRAQRLVSWQRRSYVGGLTSSNTYSTLMVGRSSCCNYWRYELQSNMVYLLFWFSSWLHIMFSTAELFPTEESIAALYLCLDLIVWVLLCKWKPLHGGNTRVRMPS